MKELEYGVVKEFESTDLWYEPMTDEIDGFILRDKDGFIVEVYRQDNICNGLRSIPPIRKKE